MGVKALFISVSELKKKSIIDGNVDSDKIVQYIEIAQDMHIQNYLGGGLYRSIQNMIVNDTLNDSANVNYKNLLESYIKPMLIWYTQAEYLPYSMFQVSNGGLFKHTSENSETVSREDMEYLVQKARNNAEFYTKRFLDYMCENSNKFTEYNNNSSPDMYPDKDVNYSGGWFI